MCIESIGGLSTNFKQRQNPVPGLNNGPDDSNEARDGTSASALRGPHG